MDLKKVSEISAVAIPFLVLCSSIQLMTYYGHWNIPIFDYLSNAEVLFLFIRPMLTIILLAALYFVLNLLFFGAISLWVVVTNKKGGEKKSGEAAASKPVPKTAGLVGYVVLAVAVVGIGLTFFQGIWVDYELWPVVILHVVIWLAAGVLIWHIRGVKKEGLPAEWLLASAIPMLLSASFFYGRYQAHYATAYPNEQTLILTDGTALMTSPEMLYLGKTSGFYFYYEVAAKQAVVVPAGQVKTIYIKPSN